MTDDHLMIVVTVLIHNGSNENPEKGSERKTSGFGGNRSMFGDIHSPRNKRKTYIIRYKYEICEKMVKIVLKNGLNIDLSIFS